MSINSISDLLSAETVYNVAPLAYRFDPEIVSVSLVKTIVDNAGEGWSRQSPVCQFTLYTDEQKHRMRQEESQKLELQATLEAEGVELTPTMRRLLGI